MTEVTANGYKKTEMGILPEDWRVEILGNLDFEVSDGNYSTKYPRQSDFLNEGVPFIRANNIKKLRIVWDDMKFISEDKHNALKKGHLKINDILITTRGELGKVAIVPEEFVNSNINAQIVRINTKEVLNPVFFLYLLFSDQLQKEIKSLKTGTTLPQLPIGKLLQIRISIPTSHEQQKIASVLSTIQEAKEKTENVINALKELKKSMTKHLFTYGPVSVEDAEKVTLKETEIGMIPEHWEVISLQKVFMLSSGKARPKIIQDHPDMKYKYPVFGGNGIMGYSEEYFIDKPTIVIGRVGEYCGAVHSYVGKAWISDNALYIRQFITDVFDINFLASLLINVNLNQYKKKSGQPLITQSIVLNQLALLPPLAEQLLIAKILLYIDNKINAETDKKQALETFFKTMLSNLMTGKIRVKGLEIPA